MVMNLNAVNQVSQGSVIYNESETVNSVSLVLKGRVSAQNAGTKIIMGSGSFLGISDLDKGRYGRTYTALDNLMIYAFPVTKEEEIGNILSMNKDYSGIMIYSLTKSLVEIEKTYSFLKASAVEIFQFIKESYYTYKQFGSMNGYKTIVIDAYETMEEYQEIEAPELSKLQYYKASAKIPLEVQKQYYLQGMPLVGYQLSEISGLLQQLSTECSNLADYVTELFEVLVSDSESCFFKLVAKLAIDVDVAGGQNGKLVTIVDDIIEYVNKLENLFVQRVGVSFKIDRKKIEDIYFVLLSGADKNSVSTQMQLDFSEQDMKQALEHMTGALRKITTYGELEEEKVITFEKMISDFMNLRDKLSGDDKVRLIRRHITDIYYELYEKVFIKAYKKKEQDRVIDLFLKYGFVDENLLTQEQLIQLYYLDDTKNLKGPCAVYNMKEWLTEIFEGRKEPSKNEFDLDYTEAFRELKRRQMFTPEQERDYFEDPYKKLNFELTNLFRYNNRLCSGQITTFVPMLYKEGFVGELKKIYATADIINEAIGKITEVDYSAFHREAIYYDTEKGIKKELIMKQVYPDIIVFPVAGSNGVMWQDITGKKRDTSGRFLLPSFIDGSLEDILIRTIGRFRWELCRTVQGTSWNNISERSLTSEFVDYIQFYKKNRELSEERKEKLKSQIQKGKNNSREIFTMDYYTWVKHESNGAIRLNKVSRAIMATYCPFNKKIRERIGMQPVFEEAMAKWNREMLKRTRELDLRIRALQKENIEIPLDIEETLYFYRDL